MTIDWEAIARRYPEVPRRAREVKSFSLDNLDELLPKALQTLEGKSCVVHLARTAQDAVDYVASLTDGKVVVKAHTLTASEIDLVPKLRARGTEVVETSVDDYVADGPGVAVGKSAEEVVLAVREAVRTPVAVAGAGITGLDAIVAETGSIVLQENEGNARAVSNLPPVHVVIAGLDKIVPTLEDAFAVMRCSSLYSTGQPLGNYVSIIGGPSRTGDIEFFMVKGMHGPKEVHLVLLDNGRTRAMEEGFGEILQCNNCMRCLEPCPLYQKMGKGFGAAYPGGRGVVFAAFQDGLQAAVAAGLGQCPEGCTECRKVCPLRIDVPRHLARLAKQASQVAPTAG